MDKPKTPEELAKVKKRRHKWEERRRRAIEAWLRWQDDIRRRIEEARKRRQRFQFWLLVGLVITQTLNNLFMPRPFVYRLDPIPKPPRRQLGQDKKPVEKSDKWQPSPENDFAPHLGDDDYCDGYSRDVWEKTADERGWRPGSKRARKLAWENDPERKQFPERYQNWDHRPSLWELVREFADRHQRSVALEALLVAAPAEAKTWLQEAHALDPGQIRRAFAYRSDQIAENMKMAAVRWEEDKRNATAEALKEANMMKKNKENGLEEDQDEGDRFDI